MLKVTLLVEELASVCFLQDKKGWQKVLLLGVRGGFQWAERWKEWGQLGKRDWRYTETHALRIMLSD